MRKFLATILLIAMLAASVAALAANVKFTGSTHVYKKAGSGKLATVIKKGSIAEKVGTKGKDWTQIRLTDKKGTKVWVRTKYVKGTKDYGTIIYSAGGAGYSTGEQVIGSIAKGWYIVDTFSKGKTNVRAKASLSSKSLGTIRMGKKIYVMGPISIDSRGVMWAKVKFNGKVGWISRANVVIAG